MLLDMGVPKAETERDLKLIADYLKRDDDGGWEYSISQLGVKYARVEDSGTYPLTPTRIHQILNKHEVKKTRALENKMKKDA